jgi:hypothetical protein
MSARAGRALMQQNSYAILRIPKNLHGRQNPTIMKKILLGTLTSFRASLRNSTTYASSPRGLLLIPLILVCFALSPQMLALSPPPDGGYPNGNTAEGDSALSGLTGGFYNSAVGFLSLLSNADASFNTGVGAGTLLVNTAGENTATGAGALLSNTTGEQNTANGAFALFSNTEGVQNTATGRQALFSNTTGSFNDATGRNALFSNTTGGSNAAIGFAALRANTTGGDNTAVGVVALFTNTTGERNTAVGSDALFDNTTGDDNTALGQIAGQNITGSGNVCIGQGVIGEAGVDDSTYIRNVNTLTQDPDLGAAINYVTVRLSDGRLGHTAVVSSQRPQAVPDAKQAKLNLKVEKLQATVTQQQKQIETLTTQLKEQAAQIQKVSAQLELSKPAAKTVVND